MRPAARTSSGESSRRLAGVRPRPGSASAPPDPDAAVLRADISYELTGLVAPLFSAAEALWYLVVLVGLFLWIPKKKNDG